MSTGDFPDHRQFGSAVLPEQFSNAELLRLERIEAKLDRLIAGSSPEVISAREAMRRLDIKSAAAFCRKRKELKIPSISWGRYRALDISNALARRALFPTAK